MNENEGWVYGVADHGRSIEKAGIATDTPKQVILKNRMAAYDYKSRLLKENYNIAYTPQDAVQFFIQEKQKKIAYLNEQIDQARGLLRDL